MFFPIRTTHAARHRRRDAIKERRKFIGKRRFMVDVATTEAADSRVIFMNRDDKEKGGLIIRRPNQSCASRVCSANLTSLEDLRSYGPFSGELIRKGTCACSLFLNGLVLEERTKTDGDEASQIAPQISTPG